MLQSQPPRPLPTPLCSLIAVLAATAILVPVRVVAAEPAPAQRAAVEPGAPAHAPNRIKSTEDAESVAGAEVDQLREQIAMLAAERARLAHYERLRDMRAAPDPFAVQRLAELALRAEHSAKSQSERQLQQLSEVRARSAMLAAQLAEERALALAYARVAIAAGPSEELY